MAYRYINAVPMSKGASVANVLGSFFKDLRVKERERQDILNLEQVRQNALAEQLMKLREKPLEVFKPQFGTDEKTKAEIEKLRAETSKTRAEAASEVWDRSAKEREADLNKRIRELELANQYEKYKRMLDKKELDLKVSQLREKYKDGAPSELDEFTNMIKHFEEIERDLLSKRENVRNDDDDLFAEYTERIKKLRKQVTYLRDNHPYGKLVDSLMPAEAAEKEKGPGWIGRRWEDVKGLAGEVKEGKVKLYKDRPLAVEDLPEAPPKPKKWVWLRGMQIDGPGKKELNNEKVLDYFTWYVAANPEDKMAMEKFQKMRSDPEFDWYFGGQKRAKKVRPEKPAKFEIILKMPIDSLSLPIYNDRKVLDYLEWYIQNNPDDKNAKQKFSELMSRPELAWYFEK